MTITAVDGTPSRMLPAGVGRGAARQAHALNAFNVSVPLIGPVRITTDQIAFAAGLGALAAFELVEWPVAAFLVVGKLLTDDTQSKVLHSFGEALEEV